MQKLSLEYDFESHSGRIELMVIGGGPAVIIEHDKGDSASISLERHEAEKIRNWLTEWLNEGKS